MCIKIEKKKTHVDVGEKKTYIIIIYENKVQCM